MSRIGFIGTGHIAAPLVRRMVRLGHEVIVTNRSRDVSRKLAASHGVATGTPQEVLDASEIVFLCLRPSQAIDILSPLTFRADHQIISVMAELAQSTLLQTCAPAQDITRTIPFGFAEDGGCPLPAWGNTALVTELFGTDLVGPDHFGKGNIILPMPQEDGLNAILTASGFMASQLALLDTVARWTQSKLGDEDTSQAYIKSLVQGFLNTMPTDTAALGRESDALSLPGSLNGFVRDQLRDAGTHDTLTTSLEAVYERLTSS